MKLKLLVLFLILVAVFLFVFWPQSINKTQPVPTITSKTNNINSDPVPSFISPLDKILERITKKKFGQYITPQNSPVQTERFTGYHTGVDFETFPQEAQIDMPINAVCTGKLLIKESVSGYGGVAVQSCQLNGQDITVIYGHLRLTSISDKVGDQLEAGKPFAVLGTGYSSETDGERKHLHLGFHKGTTVNLLGYVSSASMLSDWIDPCLYVCK